MLAGRMQILFVRSPRQNAAVDLWMQRLDTAIHHFWKAGNLRHVDDGHARIGERARGAAGGHEFEPAAHETACKRDEAALLETLRIALRMQRTKRENVRTLTPATRRQYHPRAVQLFGT